MLGAYFYGYLITSLPAGMLAENFGGKAVAGYSCLLAGILTALTPLAAAWDKWAVWVLRFLVGFFTVSTKRVTAYTFLVFLIKFCVKISQTLNKIN